MKNVATKNGEKYPNQYVAVAAFGGDVIAADVNATDVIVAAKANGVENPIIIWIPEHGALNIY